MVMILYKATTSDLNVNGIGKIDVYTLKP